MPTTPPVQKNAEQWSGQSALTVDQQQKREKKADGLATVVYLLQALHLLFGITAIIGMLISHTTEKTVSGTAAASHYKWQITTFWVAVVLYTVAFFLWVKFGLWQAVALVAGLVAIRIVRGWWRLVARAEIGRLW